VAEGVNVPPVGLIVKVTVPSGEPLFGVGAVSVSVAVHRVVAPYGNGVGLQVTAIDTESPEAAWPDGTSRVAANSNATTPIRTSLLCLPRFRRLVMIPVRSLRSGIACFAFVKESKMTL
jgi:hypothetical protein